MSQRQARAARNAAGGFVRHQTQPTPIIDAAYIQAPVSYDPLTREYKYRSGKQVRAYLAKRGVDVAALEGELNDIMANGLPTADE